MSFSEIVGQIEVKRLLENSLRKERIASAYLFYGTEGVGKTISAINFAKAMNCKLSLADSCFRDTVDKKCSSCKKIDSFSHPDVIIFFPVPKEIRDKKRRNELLHKGKLHIYKKTDIISIDDIRDIENTLLLRPFEAKRRIVIIIDAETINNVAQNAFLKILEEPPIDTTIILTSSQPERLFPTIRSRCQKVFFKRLSREEMKEFLLKRGELTDEEIELVCMLSNGSAQKALDLLDKDRKEEREFLKELVVTKDYEKLSETYSKNKLKSFIDFLIPYFRDIYIEETKERLENSEIENHMMSVSKKYSREELKETIALLGDSLINISRNINPKLISNVVYNRLKE